MMEQSLVSHFFAHTSPNYPIKIVKLLSFRLYLVLVFILSDPGGNFGLTVCGPVAATCAQTVLST